MDFKKGIQKRKIQRLQKQLDKANKDNAELIDRNNALETRLNEYDERVETFREVEEEYQEKMAELRQLEKQYREAIKDAVKIKADCEREMKELIKQFKKQF